MSEELTEEQREVVEARERARAAWARTHVQLDLEHEYELRIEGHIVESLTDDGPVIHD